MKMPIAFDNESHLIRPGLPCPPMVCLSYATEPEHGYVIHRKDPACYRMACKLLEGALNGSYILVGQYVPFDLAMWANEWPDLLEPIFQAFEYGRVHDTMTRQKMLDIANGELGAWFTNEEGKKEKRRYNLDALAKRHAYRVPLDKSLDSWRLRYAELDDVQVRDWPEAARVYSEHDAMATLWVHARQDEKATEIRWGAVFDDEARRMRAAWALYLVRCWGLRTDPVMVERYRAQVQADLDSQRDALVAAGLVYQDKKGGWHRREKVAQERVRELWLASGRTCIETPSREASLSSDAMAQLDDPLMIAFSDFGSDTAAMSKVEEVAQGLVYPIHTRYDEIMATGRTSSSDPPVQNRRTEFGDRECFVPRKGFVFADADFGGLELHSVAQVCLWSVGKSRLAERLNAGTWVDVHTELAATMLGCSVEESYRRQAQYKKDKQDHAFYLARQSGKIGNFGRVGGMGPGAMKSQARAKYGVNLTEDEAKFIIQNFHATWPEFDDYFRWINSLCGSSNAAMIVQFRSNRLRGYAPYTEACNTFMQGLGADAALAGLWALVKETYLGNGVLRGSRCVNFIHDEYLVEVPEEYGHECAVALERIVCEAANEWVPDVPMTAPADLCRRWSKGTTRVVDASGRQAAWESEIARAAGSKGYAE